MVDLVGTWAGEKKVVVVVEEQIVQLAEEEKGRLMEGRNWVGPIDVSKDSCVCSNSSQEDIACKSKKMK